MEKVIFDPDDIGRSPIQLLMDLIYESNFIRIPEEHIRYGTPVPLDQRPDDSQDENTYIPVKIDIDYDDRLSKQGGFLYRRQDLSDFFSDVVVEITATEFPFTLRSVWDAQVKPQLPFPMEKEDVKDIVFTDPHQTTIKAKATAGSYLYCGSVLIKVNPINPIFYRLAPIPFLTGFVEYRT